MGNVRSQRCERNCIHSLCSVCVHDCFPSTNCDQTVFISYCCLYVCLFPFTHAVEYSSVQQSGITNDIAYISASLSLFSISFDLVNKQVVPLCYESQQGDAQQEDYGDEAAAAQEDGGARLRFLNDNGAQCPSDGSYSYSVHYVLPSAGSESASWLASGWTGTGILEMYAQRNDAMKIGECHLTLSTYVTKQNNESLMGKPSAAATAGILLAVLLAALLMCFYCYCCIRSRKVKKDGLEPGDDITSNFRRMDTSDEHSKPPTITLDAMSQAKSKKSAKEMV